MRSTLHCAASIQSRQSRLRKRATWLGVAEGSMWPASFSCRCAAACGCKGLSSRRNFQSMVKKWTGSSSWDQGGKSKGKGIGRTRVLPQWRDACQCQLGCGLVGLLRERGTVWKSAYIRCLYNQPMNYDSCANKSIIITAEKLLLKISVSTPPKIVIIFTRFLDDLLDTKITPVA